MQMDKLGVLTSFIHNIVVYNIPLLYGTVGEIMVEKSGSLNLGVEGIMAVGAIFGYICGCYANSLAVGIGVAFLAGALCGLLLLTHSVQVGDIGTGAPGHGHAIARGGGGVGGIHVHAPGAAGGQHQYTLFIFIHGNYLISIIGNIICHLPEIARGKNA